MSAPQFSVLDRTLARYLARGGSFQLDGADGSTGGLVPSTLASSETPCLLENLLLVLSHRLGQGHTALPLDLLGAIAEELGLELPGTAQALELLKTHPEVTYSSGRSPPDLFLGEGMTRALVLDSSRRLYFSRLFSLELSIARHLAVKMVAKGGGALPVPPTNLDLFRSMFGSEGEPSDEQYAAATSALGSAFTVITGGPGTGKTSTVVKVLALLVRQARDAGAPTPRFLLVAPTGKAAARLSESIVGSQVFLRLSEDIRAALPKEALTLHRALGVDPEKPARFLHGLGRRLAVDWVIVDEASMVDVSLMKHLLDAMPEEAGLLLLGDRNQLASVEAGSVLGELSECLPSLLGGRSFRELTRSHRFVEGEGIFELSQAVLKGDVDRALKVLRGGGGQVEASFNESEDFIEQKVLSGYRNFLRAEDPASALREFGAFRVLLAHRAGPYGVDQWNQRIEGILRKARWIGQDSEFYLGRPILVTENDPMTRLVNGDIGIVVEQEGRRLVAFPSEPGGVRFLSPSELPRHETVFAMTIHKTQGSEYGEVLVVLPQGDSPLLSRELLYTAVTRAKQRAYVLGSVEALTRAVERTVLRHSGLADRIREALGTMNLAHDG